MTESSVHKELLKAIEKWVIESSSEEMIIFKDSEESMLRRNRSPSIGGYVPDIYAIGKNTGNIFIGEAKATEYDLESERSEKQLKAFIEHCKNKYDAIFVLAVPLHFVGSARSIIRSIKHVNDLHDVRTYVIDSFLLNI